ncbi:MAG: hypothetical protein EOP24_00780 [Hyphomicrobiales bacterium]|nr:MAG: hypothetical protein EOP24_00780 [Hyphomicrobiales bacterium]
MFKPSTRTIADVGAFYASSTPASQVSVEAANDNGASSAAPGFKTSTPDPAPSFEYVERGLAAIPNGDHYDRHDCVRMALIVRGATIGTPFADHGEDAFMGWAAQYPGSDPDHDLKIWRSAKNPGMGWRHLMDWVERVNPKEHALLRGQAANLAFGTPNAAPNAAAAAKGGRGGGPATVQDKMLVLIERLLAAGWECFKSTGGRYFVGHGTRVISLASDADFDEFCGVLLREFQQPMSGDSRKTLRDLLVQHAAGTVPLDVHCRAATTADGTIYIDLANPTDDVVRVTAGGWDIIKLAATGLKFERRLGMLAMPTPTPDRAGRKFVEIMCEHLNLPDVVNANSPTDAGVQARAALVCAATAYVRRKGTLPLLLWAGEMGSGKTRAATRLKLLIDPDKAPSTPSLGNDDRDLMTMTGSQLVLVVDNASNIKPSHSDVFCAILDGTGHSGRALYTNGDRYLSTAHCGISLTSIREEIVTREDLLDRTIRIEVEPLRGQRRTVEDLDRAWNQDLPGLFAAFLDLLSQGIAGLATAQATIKPADLPRLTDMALFAEAALRGQGWRDGLLVEALAASRRQGVEDNLAQNEIAMAIVAIGSFTGTMEELRERVRGQNVYTEVTNNSSRFRNAVNRLIPQLAVWGIDVKKGRTGKSRWLTVTPPAAPVTQP